MNILKTFFVVVCTIVFGSCANAGLNQNDVEGPILKSAVNLCHSLMHHDFSKVYDLMSESIRRETPKDLYVENLRGFFFSMRNYRCKHPKVVFIERKLAITQIYFSAIYGDTQNLETYCERTVWLKYPN